MSDHKNKTEVQTNRQEQKRVDQVATKVKVGDLDRFDLRFFHRDKKYLGEEQLSRSSRASTTRACKSPSSFTAMETARCW